MKTREIVRNLLEALGREDAGLLYFFYYASAQRDWVKMDEYIKLIVKKFCPKEEKEAEKNPVQPVQEVVKNDLEALLVEALLVPIRKQIVDLTQEVATIKSKVTAEEIVKTADQALEQNKEAQKLSPEEHIVSLQKDYEIVLTEQMKTRMTEWSEQGRERYVRRIYARKVLRTEGYKRGFQRLPDNQYRSWSNDFAEGKIDVQGLQQKVRGLPKPSDDAQNQPKDDNQNYVSAKKDILEIANSAGFNQETAGESYFEDIDSFARELASSEAQDADEIRSRVKITFQSAVENFKILKGSEQK